MANRDIILKGPGNPSQEKPDSLWPKFGFAS